MQGIPTLNSHKVQPPWDPPATPDGQARLLFHAGLGSNKGVRGWRGQRGRGENNGSEAHIAGPPCPAHPCPLHNIALRSPISPVGLRVPLIRRPSCNFPVRGSLDPYCRMPFPDRDTLQQSWNRAPPPV